MILEEKKELNKNFSHLMNGRLAEYEGEKVIVVYMKDSKEEKNYNTPCYIRFTEKHADQNKVVVDGRTIIYDKLVERKDLNQYTENDIRSIDPEEIEVYLPYDNRKKVMSYYKGIEIMSFNDYETDNYSPHPDLTYEQCKRKIFLFETMIIEYTVFNMFGIDSNREDIDIWKSKIWEPRENETNIEQEDEEGVQ